MFKLLRNLPKGQSYVAVQHEKYFRDKLARDKCFAPKWCTFRADRLNLGSTAAIPRHGPSGFSIAGDIAEPNLRISISKNFLRSE